jgi:hypothetical protein
LKKILFLALLIFFTGCGYKSTSTFSRGYIGNRVYIDVKISEIDPQNSVIINDAIREVVSKEYRCKIVTKKEADSIIKSKIKSVDFIPLAYDATGYVIQYKSVVKLENEVIKGGKVIYKDTTSGNYDFNIQANSAITDTKRFEAIDIASKKAIREFISHLSYKGFTL